MFDSEEKYFGKNTLALEIQTLIEDSLEYGFTHAHCFLRGLICGT